METNVESSISMSEENIPSEQQRGQTPQSQEAREQRHTQRRGEEECAEAVEQVPQCSSSKAVAPSSPESKAGGAAEPSPKKRVKKRMMGPSRPSEQLKGQYPEDDPDYCVWVPPTGQTGDGRTHLNDKYGY